MARSGGKNSAGDNHSSGGALPGTDRPGKPINSCDKCGEMYTGNSHTCR